MMTHVKLRTSKNYPPASTCFYYETTIFHGRLHFTLKWFTLFYWTAAVVTFNSLWSSCPFRAGCYGVFSEFHLIWWFEGKLIMWRAFTALLVPSMTFIVSYMNKTAFCSISSHRRHSHHIFSSDDYTGHDGIEDSSEFNLRFSRCTEHELYPYYKSLFLGIYMSSCYNVVIPIIGSESAALSSQWDHLSACQVIEEEEVDLCWEHLFWIASEIDDCIVV